MRCGCGLQALPVRFDCWCLRGVGCAGVQVPRLQCIFLHKLPTLVPGLPPPASQAHMAAAQVRSSDDQEHTETSSPVQEWGFAVNPHHCVFDLLLRMMKNPSLEYPGTCFVCCVCFVGILKRRLSFGYCLQELAQSASVLRARAVSLLAGVLGGDTLAAQYLLLTLLSKVSHYAVLREYRTVQRDSNQMELLS